MPGRSIVDGAIDERISNEQTVLSVVSSHFQTQFVSTTRLSQASFRPELLETLSAEECFEHSVFPVLFDPNSGTLSVLTGDPGNQSALLALQANAGVRTVRPVCARPAAIRAAIRKHYHGDVHAFDRLDADTQQAFQQTLDTFERHLFDEETLAHKAEEVAKADSDELIPSLPLVDLVRALEIVVGVQEIRRDRLRAHSSNVARLVKAMAGALGITGSEQVELQLAGLLHDLGIHEDAHATLIGVAEHAQYRGLAENSYKVPVEHLQGIDLPGSIATWLTHKYERWDGAGFPGRLAGQQIPLGSRLLALAEAFDDLVENSHNVYGQALTPGQALAVLSVYSDSVFDPTLLELLRQEVTGDGAGGVLETRARLLLADPDFETTAVLELKLRKDGYAANTARTSDAALELAASGRFDVVVVESELKPLDGFELVRRLRSMSHLKETPIVVVSSNPSGEMVHKAYQVGAQDFVSKPFDANVLATKLKQYRDRYIAQRTARRGVSGSLTEIALPDLLQVLCQSRRKGKLELDFGAGATGAVWVSDGRVVQAAFGRYTGEDAVYRMLARTSGEFRLDPTAKPTAEEELDLTVDALLLEGMRRIDENLNE